MGNPRLLTSNFGLVGVTTYQRDDHSFEGVWDQVLSTMLIFSGTQLSGSTLRRFDGPIAGALEGHPLYLVYWGSWWNGPGKGHGEALASKLNALMNSVYFDQLKQYGIPHAPRLAGSITVTKPEPPLHGSLKVVGDKIVELIEDLVSDDNLPDNMSSPKPLYMVLMPDTFTLNQPDPSLTTLGEHPIRYDILSPIDGRYWIGWTRSEPGNPDRMVQTLSHEIVEALTDPEFDGWKWLPAVGSFTEMSDGLWASSGPAKDSKQTAFVNGALVESYWSNLHAAPIIPIDTDYAARLRATSVEDRHRSVYEDVFQPGPEGAPLCSEQHPECCFGDRTFKWTRFAVDETARVRLATRRYRTPVVSWKINDQVVTASGKITVSVDVTSFDNARNPSAARKNVELTVTLVPSAGPSIPPGLNIASKVEGNFSVFVGATVTEGAITGSVTLGMPTAQPHIEVAFNGCRVQFEDAYHQALEACMVSLVRKYKVKYFSREKLGDRNPIDEISQLVHEQGLPGYVLPTEYQKIRRAITAVRVSHSLFEPEQARLFTRSLISQIPVLHALDVRRKSHKNGEAV